MLKRFKRFALISATFICSVWTCSTEAAQTVMTAIDSGDQPLVATALPLPNGGQVEGWRVDRESPTVAFRPGNPVSIPESGYVYLKVSYLNQGYGRVKVTFRDTAGRNGSPDRYINLWRSNTGHFENALMRLYVGRDGLELRVEVGLNKRDDDALLITNVLLQNQPFDDPRFSYLISDPWKGAYNGPTVPPQDNTTLKGKVMVGYQGWFGTPNDPEGRGWVHWGNIMGGTFGVDMWPDVSQYPPSVLEKAGEIKTKSGKPAYLFSSAWPEVVNTHFKWMQDYDIDGAFLQRFINHYRNKNPDKPERVMANVREAANRHGRIWAIEYDVSGCSDQNLLDALRDDWIWFVESFEGLKDTNYARENGKPVVFIWGMAVENRNISVETAEKVLDFFKNDPKYGGNYVIGGIPGQWRKRDAQWQEHFTKYDGLLAWTSNAFDADMKAMKKMGVTYYPHVRPGFSWANLKHLPAEPQDDVKPRRGGEYFWEQMSAAAKAGADRLFVGMFDEYDEATAIMPMSDDHPETPVKQGVRIRIIEPGRIRQSDRKIHIPQVRLPLGLEYPLKHVANTDFIANFQGYITFPRSGRYQFSVTGISGDDVKLTIGEKELISVKQFQGEVTSASALSVTAGQTMRLQLEYHYSRGDGVIELFWQEGNKPRELVPTEALHDQWGRFITNEGRPADWWLQLTRYGKEMINRKRSPHTRMPK